MPAHKEVSMTLDTPVGSDLATDINMTLDTLLKPFLRWQMPLAVYESRLDDAAWAVAKIFNQPWSETIEEDA